MNTFRLLIKGSRDEARRAAIQHGCVPLRTIDLGPHKGTVVLARADELELHHWYRGDERERELVRSGKPLPPGALLWFRPEHVAAPEPDTSAQATNRGHAPEGGPRD